MKNVQKSQTFRKLIFYKLYIPFTLCNCQLPFNTDAVTMLLLAVLVICCNTTTNYHEVAYLKDAIN